VEPTTVEPELEPFDDDDDKPELRDDDGDEPAAPTTE
jgi:hypothetical protein